MLKFLVKVLEAKHNYGELYCSATALILYNFVQSLSDKMAYANIADPDHTAPEEQSDQDLHSLPFHYVF